MASRSPAPALPPDLVELAAAWPALSQVLRDGILAMVRAATPRS